MSESSKIQTLDDLIRDSEHQEFKCYERDFEYNLNVKSLKSKLLKSTKRPAFDIIRNNGSSNLDFNVGSWRAVVLPSIRYWTSDLVGRSYKVGHHEIKIASIEAGTEAKGMQVDTLIGFLINGEKATCHFYNTTQRVMVNGSGYVRFVEEFLVPYFKSKIELNNEQIDEYNNQVIETLASKKVMRSSVRYKGGSMFSCKQCSFSFGTITALAKHRKTEHLSSLRSSSPTILALPNQSTRNNSFDIAQMDENLSIAVMDEQTDYDSTKFVCGICEKQFILNEHYVTHMKTHETQIANISGDVDLLDDSVSSIRDDIVLNEVAMNEVLSQNQVSSKEPNVPCTVCPMTFTSLLDLEWHIQTEHESFACNFCNFSDNCKEQAGAELGQAQLLLRLLVAA